MQHAHAHDCATARAGAQHLEGRFNFRKLGHWAECDVDIGPAWGGKMP
jgi:hypothetical protein